MPLAGLELSTARCSCQRPSKGSAQGCNLRARIHCFRIDNKVCTTRRQANWLLPEPADHVLGGDHGASAWCHRYSWSRFRPWAEHGSLAVRGREWTRNCAIPTRRSAFPDPAKAPKYAERSQTGQNPPTAFIPGDFRPSFGAGKCATFCSSGG